MHHREHVQSRFEQTLTSSTNPSLEDSKQALFSRERAELKIVRSSLLAQLNGVNARIKELDALLAPLAPKPLPYDINYEPVTDIDQDAMYRENGRPKPPKHDPFAPPYESLLQ